MNATMNATMSPTRHTTTRARLSTRLAGLATRFVGFEAACAACVACAACAGCAFAPEYGGGIDFTGRTLTDKAHHERGLPAEVHGVLVTQLPEGSELLAGDVRPGDVITAVDGRATKDYAELVDAVFVAGPAKPLTLTLARGAEHHDAKITTGHAMTACTLRIDLLFPFGGRILERDSQLARDAGFLGEGDQNLPPWETNEPWPCFELSLYDLDFGPDLHGFTLLRSLGYESTPGNWAARFLCFDFGRATVVNSNHGKKDLIWKSAAQLGN